MLAIFKQRTKTIMRRYLFALAVCLYSFVSSAQDATNVPWIGTIDGHTFHATATVKPKFVFRNGTPEIQLKPTAFRIDWADINGVRYSSSNSKSGMKLGVNLSSGWTATFAARETLYPVISGFQTRTGTAYGFATVNIFYDIDKGEWDGFSMERRATIRQEWENKPFVNNIDITQCSGQAFRDIIRAAGSSSSGSTASSTGSGSYGSNTYGSTSSNSGNSAEEVQRRQIEAQKQRLSEQGSSSTSSSSNKTSTSNSGYNSGSDQGSTVNSYQSAEEARQRAYAQQQREYEELLRQQEIERQRVEQQAAAVAAGAVVAGAAFASAVDDGTITGIGGSMVIRSIPSEAGWFSYTFDLEFVNRGQWYMGGDYYNSGSSERFNLITGFESQVWRLPIEPGSNFEWTSLSLGAEFGLGDIGNDNYTESVYFTGAYVGASLFEILHVRGGIGYQSTDYYNSGSSSTTTGAYTFFGLSLRVPFEFMKN